MFNIEEELKKLPDKPGVYLMKDHTGHIIYVGKAVVLKIFKVQKIILLKSKRWCSILHHLNILLHVQK